jgi:endonuclease G
MSGVEKSIAIDPNYADREGYAPAFLGNLAQGLNVPLPVLSPAQQAQAARLTANPKGFELKYHHFSLVMNGARRLAFFTAVNIDGASAQRLNRETDKWAYDPRIPRVSQIGPELYTGNELDFGHLVRRLDPVWGPSLEVAKAANDDTFHYTNCSPQHALFNRNKTTWAGLEDYITSHALAADLKVVVFTGPVFKDTDPLYRGVQLPQQFWKVVVMVKQNGKPSATAYLLDQTSLLGNIEKGLFTFGEFRTYQVSVRQIQALTGLGFGSLMQHDPLDTSKDLFPKELTAPEEIVW